MNIKLSTLNLKRQQHPVDTMRYTRLLYCLFFVCFSFLLLNAHAQVPTAPVTTTSTPSDTLVDVEILPGLRKLEILKINDSTTLQILAGNVHLKQGNSEFWCDSCVINNNTNTFEAWGNVHINDSDTTDIYSNHLRYLTKKKIAYLDGNVRLTDGKATLTTPDLDYDMSTSIGTYTHGGKIVKGATVMTSREGYYYADLKDVYFKKNVEIKDRKYYLKSDSLLVNTNTSIARFIAETYIRDSSGRTIVTRDGFYNLNSGQAEFGRNPQIVDGATKITAVTIAVDDEKGEIHAMGNVVVRDTVQQTTLIAGDVKKNNRDAILATLKPLLIIKQENDSIYVRADTLFSARLTDLYGISDSLVKDTLKGPQTIGFNNPKDSANRYFEGYRNVRIFSDSTQAAGDSVFYSFKDSVFRLFQDPVVWARGSQITGDTLYLYTKNKKPDHFQVFDNSFMINESAPGLYNQVKSTRMDGYFIDGNIDSVRARGYAECIYYIQDDDSAYTGVNESKCDVMDVYFKNQELHKVVFRSQVTGTIWPIRQKSPSDMKLQNFRWLEARRPKTKFELFE